MDSDERSREIALADSGRILRRYRWAALGTVGKEGVPTVSWVAYAVGESPARGIILHLSRLAAHTRNMDRVPSATLAVSEPERRDIDPQCLARLSLEGTVSVIEMGTPGYARAVSLYQARLPDSVPRFGFGDFRLFLLEPARVRYVGGFARAFTFSGADLFSA